MSEGRQWTATVQSILEQPRSCACVGPQNGQPKCPCQMRGMIERNGRWVQPEQDFGPVQGAPEPKGIKCPKCPMVFELGKAYGYCCPNGDCPTQFKAV